jgi:hypothetical protein
MIVETSNTYGHITWTDFGQGGRVHILSRHLTEKAGVNCVRRFGKAYENLKLIRVPEGYESRVLDGDVIGDFAEAIRNQEVIYQKKKK